MTYFGSTFAVASSSTRILFFLKMALAKQTNCLCPTDRFEPPSLIFASRPSFRSSTAFVKWAWSNELQISASEYSSKGSKFFLRLEANSSGSRSMINFHWNGFVLKIIKWILTIFIPWGMIDIFFRKSCRPIFPISILSIRILPVGSESLNKAVIREDFPAPVLPTIPILSLAAVLKFIFFKINFAFSSYLNETSWNSTIPVENGFAIQRYYQIVNLKWNLKYIYWM